MPDRLSRAIAAFDGADPSVLAPVVAAFEPTADDLAGLVVLLQVGDEAARIAASWVLARFLERGLPLLPAERRTIVARLEQEGAWQVRLYLCGAVRNLRTPPDAAAAAAASLQRLAADPHRHVRAAALDGLAALAVRFPALAPEARACLETALADPAPSVRARARVLLRDLAG